MGLVCNHIDSRNGRVQGLDGEATEPMIKELEDDREEVQDPEVEFAIAGVMQECGGLEIVVSMVQVFFRLRVYWRFLKNSPTVERKFIFIIRQQRIYAFIRIY